MKSITILHTNDIHSHFESFACAVHQIKKYYRPQTDVLLDAGDFADERSILVAGTAGTGAIRLLMAAGYDAMAIGNNEFFQGYDALKQMASLGFPMLACNLHDLHGNDIPGIRPYLLLQRNHLRLLVIGVCPYWDKPGDTTSFTDMSGITVFNPVDTIRQILTSLRGRYDRCILLSHAGYDNDILFAETINGIDAIIGGHSHTLMKQPEVINGTWIHQSGCHGEWIGELQLGEAETSGRQIPVGNVKDKEILALIRKEEKAGIANLSTPLYDLAQTLPYDAYRECAAVNAIADTLYQKFPCDFAMIHSGILSAPITSPVSQMSLLQASPSPLNPTSVFWTGKQIKEALIASFDDRFIRQYEKWAGFRGTVLGALGVSHNVQISKAPFTMTIQGQSLDEKKIYHVETDDFLFRGSGYTMLKGSRFPEQYAAGYIRDLLREGLRNPELVQIAFQKRIREH